MIKIIIEGIRKGGLYITSSSSTNLIITNEYWIIINSVFLWNNESYNSLRIKHSTYVQYRKKYCQSSPSCTKQPADIRKTSIVYIGIIVSRKLRRYRRRSYNEQVPAKTQRLPDLFLRPPRNLPRRAQPKDQEPVRRQKLLRNLSCGSTWPKAGVRRIVNEVEYLPK